jgi:hypothetical protein
MGGARWLQERGKVGDKEKGKGKRKFTKLV